MPTAIASSLPYDTRPDVVRPERLDGAAAVMARLGPALLLFYAAMLPQEMRLEVAGLALYPYRIAAILAFPWTMLRLLRGAIRWHWADALLLAGASWMLASFIAFYGISGGLVRGGALVIDIVPVYLVARACFSSPDDLRRFLVLCVPGAAIAGSLLVIEAAVQEAVVRPFAARLFGALPAYQNGIAIGVAEGFVDYRLGLLRAAGPFPHPILAGLFLASLVPLVWFAGLRGWPFWLGLVAGMTMVLAVSSAPLLVFLIFLAAALFDAFQRRSEAIGWRHAIVGTGLVVATLQFASQSGLVPIIIRFTLNPVSGYYRRLTWEYGMASVAEHPWFGIGYTDYEREFWMHNSIDNHWLMLAVRHGIVPSLAFLALSALAIWLLVRRAPHLPETDRRLFVGLGVTIGALVIAGFTVALFGGMQTWFFLLLGAVIGLAGHGKAAPVRPPES